MYAEVTNEGLVNIMGLDRTAAMGIRDSLRAACQNPVLTVEEKRLYQAVANEIDEELKSIKV